jgi:hypothetical protein
MNKKILIIAIAIVFVNNLSAQRTVPTYTDDEGVKGFRKENIFIGGGLNLGFASNTFAVGLNPEIGYSVAQWLDAGLGFNINYASQRADPFYNNNVRQRNFSYGGGPFVRLYPVRFLFIQGQLEENWTTINVKDYNYGQTGKYKYNATSFIAGVGYTQRIIGQSSFYTLIAMDLMRDINSPYRDYNNAAIPIIRAGFDFYLRPKRKR